MTGKRELDAMKKERRKQQKEYPTMSDWVQLEMSTA